MSVDFDMGAPVRAADGRLVGRVAGVVVDPARDAATDLVVRLAQLYCSEKVVALDQVEAVEDHAVTLRLSLEQVEDLPELDERAYIALAAGPRQAAAERYLWINPPPAQLPPLETPEVAEVPFVVEEWRTLPERHQVLRKGLAVRARDGQPVGAVEELVTDGTTGELTHVVVRVGRLVRHSKAVPARWIVRYDESAGITLAVHRAVVERLPDYH